MRSATRPGGGLGSGVCDLEVCGAVVVEHLGGDDPAHRQDQPARDHERHDEHDGASIVDGRSGLDASACSLTITSSNRSRVRLEAGRFGRSADRASGVGAVERVGEGVPAEHGALDAHRELDDALQRFEVAEGDVVVAGLRS